MVQRPARAGANVTTRLARHLMMTRWSTLPFMGVVAVALLLTPTQARAQFFYNPGFGYGGYGFGGFDNYRGFGGFGGFGNPYFGGYGSPYNSPYFGGSRPTVNSTT